MNEKNMHNNNKKSDSRVHPVCICSEDLFERAHAHTCLVLWCMAERVRAGENMWAIMCVYVCLCMFSIFLVVSSSFDGSDSLTIFFLSLVSYFHIWLLSLRITRYSSQQFCVASFLSKRALLYTTVTCITV